MAVHKYFTSNGYIHSFYRATMRSTKRNFNTLHTRIAGLSGNLVCAIENGSNSIHVSFRIISYRTFSTLLVHFGQMQRRTHAQMREQIATIYMPAIREISNWFHNNLKYNTKCSDKLHFIVQIFCCTASHCTIYFHIENPEWKLWHRENKISGRWNDIADYKYTLKEWVGKNVKTREQKKWTGEEKSRRRDRWG